MVLKLWFFIILQCNSKAKKRVLTWYNVQNSSHLIWDIKQYNCPFYVVLPLSIALKKRQKETFFFFLHSLTFFIWCRVSIFIHNICQPAPLFSNLRQQTMCTETPRSVWKFKEWLSLSHFSAFNFKGSLLSVAELLLEINEHIWLGLHCSHRKCPSTALWFMDSRQCMSCNLRGVCFSSWRWNFKILRLITPLILFYIVLQERI